MAGLFFWVEGRANKGRFGGFFGVEGGESGEVKGGSGRGMCGEPIGSGGVSRGGVAAMYWWPEYGRGVRAAHISIS